MKTNKQVKRLIAIFLIALGIVIGLVVSAQAQTEIAYKERLIKAAENARLKTDSVFAKELLKLSIPILSKNKIIENTAYWVVIENNDVVTTRKSRTIKQLREVVKQYYPKSEIDIAEFMKESIFFEIHRYQFRFYVEKKQITKKGKLRKLRKKQIRQIERN